MLFDSHCHLQFNAFKNDQEEVIFRCVDKKMTMNVVGTQKNTSKKAVELAGKHKNIYASIGLHPIHLFPTHVDEEKSNFVYSVFSKKRYQYEDEPIPSEQDLIKLLPVCYENFEKVRKSISWSSKTKIILNFNFNK